MFRIPISLTVAPNMEAFLRYFLEICRSTICHASNSRGAIRNRFIFATFENFVLKEEYYFFSFAGSIF